MKQLRILTGSHSGAQLDLKQRQYRIGSDDEADILISDWTHAPMELVLDEGNSVMLLALESTDAAATAAGAAIRLEDHVPQRFAEIVLCAGSADSVWPSDMALMSRLLRHAQQGTRSAAKVSRRFVAGALFGSVVLLGAFTALVARTARQAQAKAPVVPLWVNVQQAVSRSGVAGVAVRQAGEQAIVEGLVQDGADIGRLRTALQAFAEGSVLHRYAAASDLAQSISDALGNPGLRVAYAGGGVFTVSGGAVGIDKVRASVQRIAADLGPLVKRIDLGASELPPPQRVRVDSMLAGDDVQYVQTADGTKHLSLSPSAVREPVDLP